MRTKNYIVENGHWLWVGSTTEGCPCIKVNGKTVMVRRLFWERKNGPIPLGARMDLVCDYKNCVHPDCCKPHVNRWRVLPGMTHAQLRARRLAIYSRYGKQKIAATAAEFGVTTHHVSRVNTLGRTHQL